jgi:TrfA protein.
VQLPLWYDHERGIPNTFPRSELFAAIQGKDRLYLKSKLLSSPQNVEITYTGEQLDQSDLDVWEQAVHIARNNPLGHVCLFSAHSFLKSLGRNTGKSDHDWLESVFTRLTACEVKIQRGEHDLYAGSLIHSRTRTGEKRIYRMELDPALIRLFGTDDFTRLDWQQRQMLSRQPLALWLHAFYSTHARPFPMKIDTLHRLSGSNAGASASAKRNGKKPDAREIERRRLTAMRDWKRKLKAALTRLQEIGFVQAFEIEGDKVTVQRSPRLPRPS